MHDDEDLQVVGTTSDYLIQQLTDEEEGKDFAVEYFKSGFMSSAADTLFYMRRQAGLTQAQVAERLNTKQSAIARLESDSDGSISLRRYIDFALACGMVPHDITFAPLESVVNYKIAQPETLYTQANYQEWLKANSQANSVPVESDEQAESDSEAMDQTLQSPDGTVSSTKEYTKSASTDDNNSASFARIHHKDYIQPYLIPPLQLLPSVDKTSTALESQDKTLKVVPSKVG